MNFRSVVRAPVVGAVFFAAVVVFLSSPAPGASGPEADYVSPQRLTVFVGAGDHRVRIEGENLDEVDEVIAVDASQTGFIFEVEEVEARILHAEEDLMIVLLRAEEQPERDDYLQLQFRYVHQKYLVPAGLFQFEVE